MDRARVLALLEQRKPTLTEQIGMTRPALFGSTVRDVARDGSDIDLLVAFDAPATAERYLGVQLYLEDLLGCAIELVTEKGLREELRPFIEAEAADV